MTDDIKKDVPSEKGQTSEQVSEGVNSGSTEKPTDEALSKVPEHLKGKEVGELLQMYQNLEKKLGEQSSEVSEARQTKKNVEVLLSAIYADPKHYEEATQWINQYLGVQPQEKTNPNESSEGAKTRVQREIKPRSDDTRRALQNQILADFYQKHGLDKLPEEDRKKEQVKIANSFAELVDPGGNKPIGQVLEDVPLDRLPKYLDNSYFLANKERFMQEGRQQGLLTAEENRQASIGSLASSGAGKGEITLTPSERAVAMKLKISPEDYAKKKAEIIRAKEL